jgi:hypothetical protein
MNTVAWLAIIDVASLQLLKAGVKRLAAQLLSIIDSDDRKRHYVVSQIRTVSTILALALNHSRRAGFHCRASSGGIADPSTYITSLRSLVGHLGECDAGSQKSSDILETSFLTLRLYLAMVGGSPEMAALSPQVIIGLLTTTNDLIQVGSGVVEEARGLRDPSRLTYCSSPIICRSLRDVESSGVRCAWIHFRMSLMVSASRVWWKEGVCIEVVICNRAAKGKAYHRLRQALLSQRAVYILKLIRNVASKRGAGSHSVTLFGLWSPLGATTQRLGVDTPL